MKLTIALIVLAIALAAPATAREQLDGVINASDLKVAILAPLSVSQKITISCGSGTLEITWKDEKLDVIYHDCTRTDAADRFFEFLRKYVSEGYVITKKEETK